MNGLLGRTRRVLAGLISAMMVLTSLPLTGVAAYAAPSENAAMDEAAVAGDEAAAADVDEVAAADEADDAAVADEADEAAQPDGDPEELVTISFNRGGIYGVISVSVNETEYDFEAGKDTVSANVPVGVPLTFAFILSPIPSPGFYAFPTYNGSADRITRDSEDLNLFTFTPDSDGVINVGSVSRFEVSVDSSSITGSFTGTVKNSGKDYLNNPAEDIVFTLSNIPEEFISYTVKAAAGTQELAVSRTGNENEWKISANEAKKAVYAQAPIKITVEGITAAKQSVTFKANEDVTAITYGPTDGDENTVSMADAKSASGATVSVNAGKDQKMKVIVSDEALLLSDSVTVDDRTVTKDEDDTYKISVNEAAVAVDVKAYKKVLISVNNLMDTAGKKTFATIGVHTGMDDGDLTDGEAITFGYYYASEVSDYDVNLAAPEAYTRKGSATTPITMIAPEGDEVTGEYTIKKEDVEAAIRDSAEIFIYAKGEIVPKVKLAFTIPDDGTVNGITYSEYSLSKKKYVKNEETVSTSGWTSTSVDGIRIRKGEIEVQAGNTVYLDEIDDNDATAFFRPMKDSKVLSLGINGYSVPNVKAGDTVNIVASRLKLDEVSIAVTGNGKTVSYNLTVDPNYVITKDSVKYIKTTDGTTLKVTGTDNDPVWEYKLDDARFSVNKGYAGNMLYDTHDECWYIPDVSIEEAAFAKADSKGIKLYVTARVVKTGTKPQTLTMISDPYYSGIFDVIQGGAKVHNTTDGSEDLKYNDPVSVTVTPQYGYALDKVYLVKDEALKTASLNAADADFVAKFKDKLSQNKISATPFAPGKDGTAKFSLKKMDAPYTVVALSHPEYELVVKVSESDERILPDSNGIYDLDWYKYYELTAKKGEDSLKISGNSLSANNGEKDVTAKLIRENTSSDRTSYTFRGADDELSGRTATVSFVVKDTTPGREEVKFRFSKKPGADAVRFAEGVLSENKIIKPQPLGATRTYDLTVAEGLDLAASTNADVVTASLAPVKNRAGKVTGYKLTVGSGAVGALTGNGAYVTLYDRKIGYYGWNKTVFVSFSTDQVKNADLSKITATGDSDSITFDFSKVENIDRTTEGLYYLVSVSTGSAAGYCAPLKKEIKDKVPASASSYTLSLTTDLEDYCPNEITYKADVDLVQENAIGNEIVRAAAPFSDPSVKTKADAVFATRMKLQKVKPAKTLYAGVNGEGSPRTLIAKVVYPRVKGKAVTATKVKKIELLDSAGNIVDINGPGYPALEEDQGNLYFASAGSDLAPGRYTVVAYATEPLGKDVTATMPINVVMPIYKLEMNLTSDTLYKRPNKAASLPLGVLYNDGTKKTAPKTKKVTWNLVDDHGKPFTFEGISIKKGRLTVAKNVVLPADGISFYIKAVPADYDHGAGGPAAESGMITVMPVSAAPAPADLVVNDMVVKPGTMESSYLFGEVAVVDADGNLLENVSIKATGALKAAYPFDDEPDLLYLLPVKLGKGTVKVKTTDGSNLSKTFKFTVKPDDGLYGKIGSTDDAWGEDFDLSRKDFYVTNTDKTGHDLISMMVLGRYMGGVDHKIKVSGIKKMKKGPELSILPQGYYVFKPTARDATVTITDKKTKQKVTIHVTNVAFPPNTQKTAAKVTASNLVVTTVGKPAVDKKGMIYTDLGYDSVTAYDRVSCNYVTYTVKYGKNQAAKVGDKVRIDILDDDRIAHPDMDLLKKAMIKAGGALIPDTACSYELGLGEGGAFRVNYVDTSGGCNLSTGTYRFQVTPLDEAGDPAYKSAVVKLKVVSAPKASVKAAKAVKFTGTKIKEGASANVVFTKELNIAAAVEETKLGAEYPEQYNVRGINVGGKINDFAKMFEVRDGKLVYTGEKSKYYDAKKGISGMVAVSYTGLDGIRRSTYVPVTVTGDFYEEPPV